MARGISTKISIEGNAEYKNALKEIASQLNTTKSEMALVTSAFKGQENSSQALAAKLEVLNKQYEQQAQKVQTMRAAQENAAKVQSDLAGKAEEYRKKVEETEAALTKLKGTTGDVSKEQNELLAKLKEHNEAMKAAENGEKKAGEASRGYAQSANYAEAELNRLRGTVDTSKEALRQAQTATEDATKSLEEYGDSAQAGGEKSGKLGSSTGQAMNSMAAALSASGVAQGFQEITKAIEECLAASTGFGKGIAEVYTLLPGLSDEARAKLSGDLVALSTEMGIVGTEGTDALYQAVSAGVSAGKSMQFMETAQKAAVGGVTNLETAVDGLTSVTNAYGKENLNSTQAADLMFTAVKLGKTNFEQLSSSLYNVVPIAANSGIAFEDITAALAAMTAQGVPTAQSTTQMRQMLVELTDSGTEVSKTFEMIAGKSFKQFIAEGGNTQKALQLLSEKASNTGVGINELFSSVEAGSAAIALSGKNAQRFANNIDEMKASAGACDTAFDEMSKTADFANKKFSAAAQGLQIAMGSALEPQLVKMKEMGADAFAWATQFVEENPWVVSAISAVAVSLGVLAAAFTGVVLVTEVVIPAIKAFNLAMASNPIGLVVIAIGALVAGIAALAATWPEATSAASEAADAAEKSAERLRGVAAETRNSAAAAETSAEVCRRYAERLQELENAGLNTAASQQEYADTVAKLNDLMPDLNLEIDEQTGLLKDNGKAIEDSIDAMKEKAKATAYMEQYNAAVEESVKAEIALDKFRRESGEEQIAQLDEMLENQKRYAELGEKLSGDTSDLSFGEVEEMTEQWRQLGYALDTVPFEVRDLEEAQSTLTETVDSTAQSVADAKGAYDDYNQSVAESADAQAAAAEAAGFNAEYMAQLSAPLDEATESMRVLGEETAAAQEGIAGTLEGLFGTFNNVKVETEATAADLLSNLDSQIAYMDTYQANLDAVIAKSGDSISQELIAKLSDGSMESAKILQTMAGATEDEILAMNEKFGMVSEGKDKFSTQIGLIATDFNTKMGEIQKKMGETVMAINQAEEAAKNAGFTVSAIVNTVRNRMDEVFDIYAALGEKANAGYKSTLKINSPSKAFMQHTDSTVEGVEVSAKAGEARVHIANQKLAQAGIGGYMNTLKNTLLSAVSPTQLPPVNFEQSFARTMDSYYKGVELVRRSQTNNYDSRKTSYSYGNTYVIDGITYDDGSNVAEAVKSLVRAARVGRRA